MDEGVEIKPYAVETEGSSYPNIRVYGDMVRYCEEISKSEYYILKIEETLDDQRGLVEYLKDTNRSQEFIDRETKYLKTLEKRLEELKKWLN